MDRWSQQWPASISNSRNWTKRIYSLHLEILEKKLKPWERDVPHGVSLRRWTSHIARENPRTMAPPIYSGNCIPVRWDGYRPVFWCGIDERIFLPSSLKFIPVENRTQDLTGATEAIKPVSLVDLWLRNTWRRVFPKMEVIQIKLGPFLKNYYCACVCRSPRLLLTITTY